jgi:hypothetical protein
VIRLGEDHMCIGTPKSKRVYPPYQLASYDISCLVERKVTIFTTPRLQLALHLNVKTIKVYIWIGSGIVDGWYQCSPLYV